MRAVAGLVMVGLLGLSGVGGAPVAEEIRAGGEIYGTIVTRSGESFTGPVRWDKNENFWGDRLDAAKEERIQQAKKEQKGFRLNLFGLELARVGGEKTRTAYAFSIPFGHIVSIEPQHPAAVARLTLKNGESVTVRASSSDLGPSMRSLIIDDTEKGEVNLSWGQIKRIDFNQAPRGESRDDERLHGTVSTRVGSFVGFVIWDRDESMFQDVLDGDEQSVEFGKIRKIERLDQGGSRVTLRDDQVLELSGTNDVDDGHRGVVVAVEGLGTVEIDWSDFEQVVFGDPPASPAYAEFDGGAELSGRVQGADGDWAGQIIWDGDETHSWETLDGEADGVNYAIPFEQIDRIQRVDDSSSRVKLRNGHTLVLSGSNDVNDDNYGVIVVADGERIELQWRDLELVDFN